MSEKRWCNNCGLESRNPRLAPITNGLCKPCADREKARKIALKEKVKQLRSAMAAAIKVEDYEQAAIFRDSIEAAKRET